MPFLLIVIGTLLAVVAIRDTLSSLTGHLSDDLTATQNGVTFMVWVAALLAVGLIGFIPKMQGFSRAMLALVVVVVVLRQGSGLWSQFFQQIQSVPPSAAASTPANIANPTVNVTVSGGGSNSSSGLSSGLSGAAASAASIFLA